MCIGLIWPLVSRVQVTDWSRENVKFLHDLLRYCEGAVASTAVKLNLRECLMFTVTFKIATITFNLLKFHGPSYLYQFVQPYTPSRNLRSLNQNLLVVNRAHSAFAERSFQHTSATVWNSLSAKCRNCLGLTVETFRKHLKAHLFETAWPLPNDRLGLWIGLLRPT